jgi:antitoxin ChpS
MDDMRDRSTKWGEIDDAVVRSALRRLERALRRRFGDRFVRVILFGSRARGTAGPDSDADVAVVFRDRLENRWATKVEIIKDAYPILLDTGLYIQPWPIEEATLEHPEQADNPALVRDIVNEGIRP